MEIIESLIALVIIFSLFLAYRGFFAKDAKAEGSEAGHSLDTSQIEKALQKILENQNHSKESHSAEGARMNTDLDALDREASETSSMEIQELRSSLSESHKKIEKLQTQLQEAVQKATELAEASAAPAESSKESEEFKNKIRDLEARLSEYEIIAEDIADLSRYRDENEQLKKDLEALKGGGSVVLASAPAESAPASSQAISESKAELELDAMIAEAAKAPSEPISPPPAAAPAVEESASADLVDDDLMKEFAAAVESQKSLGKVAEKAGDGKEAAVKSASETDQLMDEFENFVGKKG